MMKPAPEPYLCRDCLLERAGPCRFATPRCPSCGGAPRGLHHRERDNLGIAHIDCDAFFAAVEKRENPDLADRPVIIGGGRRGVVSTACYIARIDGVRSAMPMFKALEACPHAVLIPSAALALYAEVGRQVRDDDARAHNRSSNRSRSTRPFSISPAPSACTVPSPALTLARFARRVEEEIGITVSVGLSYNKFLAKIASDQNKPRGFSIIGQAEARAFLAEKPVGILPGIGKVSQDRLARAGIRLIADLATRSLEDMMRIAGNDGPRLLRLARGEDARRVEPERAAKSVSNETTFDEDIAALARLEPILWRLAEKVSRRLRTADIAGRTVVLKLKTKDFRTRTRTVFRPRADPAREPALCGGTADARGGVRRHRLSPDRDRRRRSRRCRTRRSRRSRRSRGRGAKRAARAPSRSCGSASAMQSSSAASSCGGMTRPHRARPRQRRLVAPQSYRANFRPGACQ